MMYIFTCGQKPNYEKSIIHNRGLEIYLHPENLKDSMFKGGKIKMAQNN